MIQKLYDLKKSQTDLKLMEKGQLLSKVEQIDSELTITQMKINTTGVQPHGAISDFTILQMHKNSMKLHMQKLEVKKKSLEKQINLLVEQIVELQKQSEQFAYILSEEKKEKIKQRLKAEESASEEYMQSKFINNKEH